MSHLLAVVGKDACQSGMFARLLARFERLSGCRIACRTERDWCTFAVTSPEFGASQALVIDPESGAFLAIIGAWVEVAGPGPASPERLLRRCLREPLTSVVRDIEGAFFLVFGDPRTHGVAMATDIVGSLHVFVRDVPGGLAICTSARALAALGAGALDPVGRRNFGPPASSSRIAACGRECESSAPGAS